MNSSRIDAARAEAERARARLMATAQELQARLSPGMLAKGAWQGAKEKGADLAEDAVDAVRARPWTTTGLIAAVAMFLAREPLMDLATRLKGNAARRKPRKPARAGTTQRETENA